MTKLNLLPKKPGVLRGLWVQYKNWFLVLVVLSFMLGLAVGIIWDINKSAHRREAFMTDIIERCKPLHNIMNGNKLRTTYECPNGETFEIEGKI